LSTFTRKVLDAVDRIPPGRVMSYGDVAELVDHPGASRAVGAVMARYGAEVPWHRVLHNDGSCAAHQVDRQLALLREEDVPIRGGRVQMRVARWDGPEPSEPAG
jgi:O-6-methylguanine DNA methyltransferase